MFTVAPSVAYVNAAHLSSLVRSRLTSSSLPRTRLSHRSSCARWAASYSDRPSPDLGVPTAPGAAETASRRLRKGDMLDLVFTRIAYGGASVAYVPDDGSVCPEDVGMPVYAPKGACPGELIRCAVHRVRRRNSAVHDPSLRHVTGASSRSYAEVLFIERLRPAESAVPVPCVHFGNFRLGGGGCGGCSTMHVSYELQVAEKQSQMEGIFSKISAMHRVKVLPIAACENILHYRNKMEFSFGRRWYHAGAASNEGGLKGPGDYEYALGLHAPQRFDKVVHIQDCHIQESVCNDILDHIRKRAAELLLEAHDTKMKKGYMRNIVLRTTKNEQGDLEVMVNFITSPCDVLGRLEPLAMELKRKFPSIVCVLHNVRGVKSDHIVEEDRERLLAGSRKYIEQLLCGLKFRISANSFFQTNSEQSEVLYKKVREAAQLSHEDTVLDLFCGTGTIGLSLASAAKQVVGVDIVAAAIEDARMNASLNGITNVLFHQGNLGKVEDMLDSAGLPDPDIIIVDPPRAGLHPDLIRYIGESSARRVVYVSCNPLSQVRDLEALQTAVPGRFSISTIQPVDMFPNTPHMECVVALERTRAVAGIAAR